MKEFSLMGLVVLLPLLGTLLMALSERAHARAIALTSALATVIFAFSGLLPDDANQAAGFYHVTHLRWLPELGLHIRLGADGVSGWLVLLTAVLGLGTLLCPTRIDSERVRVYYGCILCLVGLLCGAFLALDLVVFYLFFEASLLPVYFLIGIFGGTRRRAAAQKFFIFSVIGALAMLASIIGIWSIAGTFELTELKARGIPADAAGLLFVGFAVAFAVKTPLVPLHTWQADAYQQLPTPVVALVGGAMAKLGTYGFFRICLWLLPEASGRYAPVLCAVAALSIVWAALVAAVQKDLKRLMAYSSVSHLGFVVLGLFSGTREGITGGCVQMINHGIIAGGIFYLLAVLEVRTGTLRTYRLGGLWERMPVFARLFLLFTLASVALPLTNGFVGEFLTLLGAYKSYPVWAAIATTGVIWSAVYMLGMYQRVFFMPPARSAPETGGDIADRELGLIAPIAVLIFLLGIYPLPVLSPMDGPVARVAPPTAAKGDR
jgi:NADH-quinone oxidoreductase subunit M